MPKLKFINPSIYLRNNELLKFKKIYFPAMQFLILASLTPDNYEISYIDELIDNIDLNEKTDLVCISLNTFQARRAYELADAFRNKGKKVILGGIHASTLPEEAKQHADSVVIGEAEDIWPQILVDFEKNQLKPFYKVDCPPNLKKLILPRLDLLNFKKYSHPPLSKMPIIPLDTSRGCPNRCDFCVISPFQQRLRLKPIENVVAEIKAIGAKYFFFSDSNICANKARAKELFKALIPLKIKWVSNFHLDAAEDAELLKLAAKSGCISAYLGLESLNEENLKSVNKRNPAVAEYKKHINTFHRCKVPIQASLILGLDFDTKESIQTMVKFIINSNIDKVSLYVLCPFPGTKLYEQFKKDGRLFEDAFWLNPNKSVYDIHYKPKNFSLKELEDLFWQSYEEIYSPVSIIKRLFFPLQPHWLSSLVSNWFHRRAILKKQITIS